MTLYHLCQWLSASSFGTAIRESQYGFPIIETAHVLGITILVGTVAIVDLRLLGVVLKREQVSVVVSQVLPLTWCGFAVMFISGFLLLWSRGGTVLLESLFSH